MGDPGRIGAFFDLDGTLLSVNSGELWIKRERKAGRLRRRQYLLGAAYLVAYRVNMLNMDVAMRKALATIRGKGEAAMRDDVRQWYHDEVASLVAPGAWDALREHREQGHALVLLTSSSPYEAEVAAEQFELDDWISSAYEVNAGVFTGEPIMPICYAEGKVVYAERYAARAGIDLDRSFFYTDSRSDLPMLQRVGEPRAVNPDLRLAFAARRRGWPILKW